MKPAVLKQEEDVRYTIVDDRCTVSFGGPGHAMKVFAAACSSGANDLRSLLELATPLDQHLTAFVRSGLSVFDEHVLPDRDERRFDAGSAWPFKRDSPIRVWDDATRRLSLQPGPFGLLIFNLAARRIVQVQNSFGPLLREDRGRIRQNGSPTNEYFCYRLPTDWKLLP